METHQEYVSHFSFPWAADYAVVTGGSPLQSDAYAVACVELKETHLAPLTQTFTRSSSTSTIKGGDSSEESQTPVVPQPPTPSTDSEQISMPFFFFFFFSYPSFLTVRSLNLCFQSRFGVPRLAACRSREAWYPDRHPS